MELSVASGYCTFEVLPSQFQRKKSPRNLKHQFNFPRFGSETLDYKSFSEKWSPKVV